MKVEIAKLLGLLNEVSLSSKSYVNSRKNSDSGEYFKQLWTARSVSKSKAKEELLNQNMDLFVENKELVQFLLENKVIVSLELDENDSKENLLFLLPTGLELISLLTDYYEDYISYTELEDKIQLANNNFYNNCILETVNRLQEPLLETEAMSAKSTVFCWFLLLTGATCKDRAFIIQKQDKDGEFEYQEEIVRYLNEVSKFIFPNSFKNKTGKIFKEGDLSNFIRRNKEIKTSYGEYFKIEDEAFYFDIHSPDNENYLAALSKVVSITLKRINHFSVPDDEMPTTIVKSIDEYYLNNPIKQAHLKSLFAGRPEYSYFQELQYVVKDELDNIFSVN
ncbi:hypothetical protein P9314_02965 [Paenibacillus validus]|uniref:hypothetical protein n=1 Tax=Paenibacillus validus TaxID=44253 RepID=UPI000FD90EB4|nr:hypothetical protein [Paenibacillus validus]MED4599665.1 hypothetical protein [Paenibacillus validus]MED4604571.1 hypothetical protein [Paenibacillus validus]